MKTKTIKRTDMIDYISNDHNIFLAKLSKQLKENSEKKNNSKSFLEEHRKNIAR